MNIQEIQKALKAANIDGWLFFDFKGKDPISNKMLNMDMEHLATRRWYYFVPQSGEPIKLANKIEPYKLDHLPGIKNLYQPWEELHRQLKSMLRGISTLAMQYSPMNNIPYVSNADAGTVELIRSFGIEVVSSGDLVSQFEAYLDDKDYESHAEAGRRMHILLNDTFKEVANRIRSGNNPTEYEIMKFMHQKFEEHNLFSDHGPIVGVNEHAADPHFEPTEANSHIIKEGDLLLIDTFAKLKEPNSIWYDITWMAYVGTEIPDNIQKIWEINRDARDKALKLMQDRFANDEPVYGFEGDDAARNHIIRHGFGEFFIHRTGHNISTILHGNGAHLDNFETKDLRRIIKGSCFSIEPGIYMPEEKIGFRTEIDVFVRTDGKVEVCGPIQRDLVKIMEL